MNVYCLYPLSLLQDRPTQSQTHKFLTHNCPPSKKSEVLKLWPHAKTRVVLNKTADNNLHLY